MYVHLGCILRESTLNKQAPFFLCGQEQLISSLAAALLALFQFVPIIRHKAILFHRINGYVIIALVLVSHIGALMIARDTFGGLTGTQAAVGFLVILSTGAIGMAYYNVKHLQLEQHRAWMLRAFFYVRESRSFPRPRITTAFTVL